GGRTRAHRRPRPPAGALRGGGRVHPAVRLGRLSDPGLHHWSRGACPVDRRRGEGRRRACDGTDLAVPTVVAIEISANPDARSGKKAEQSRQVENIGPDRAQPDHLPALRGLLEPAVVEEPYEQPP